MLCLVCGGDSGVCVGVCKGVGLTEDQVWCIGVCNVVGGRDVHVDSLTCTLSLVHLYVHQYVHLYVHLCIYNSHTHPTVPSPSPQAKAQGLEYKVGKFAFMANSRARTVDTAEGLVKFIADKKTDKILGVQVGSLIVGVG